ncbi:MAG: methyl-accepting chemotaxis sensory transducer [Frankiales bacterium]|nr:methyl-accepting chemotaxis sensory transducer [Frankiales bacterium]
MPTHDDTSRTSAPGGRLGRRLANLGLRRKLGATLAVAVLGLTSTGVAGLQSQARLETANRDLTALSVVQHELDQVKFYEGDMAGWQVAYTWDADFMPAAKAVSDDGPDRKFFLADKQQVLALLGTVHTEALTPAERSRFTHVQELWTAFLAADDRIVSVLRPGGRKDVLAARADITGPSYEIFDKLFASTDELVTGVQARAKALHAQSLQAVSSARRLLLVAALLAALVVSTLTLLIARTLLWDVARLEHVVEGLGDGDLTRRADLTSTDEIGRMAGALDRGVERVAETVRSLREAASTLHSTSGALGNASADAATSAEQASAQADVVSCAADDVSRNVQTVSTGASEMGASIREIAQNANEAASVARDAVEVAERTSALVGKLGGSSAEIGNVVKVITSIAEQTNLLALNATIEAARAGEAGKGFAVVASEVKDLAQATGKATEDITERIEAIQSDTAGAVQAISEITAVIAAISDYQTSIAGAVEEQTATTAEMSRSVGEAAAGSNEIALNISGVAQAASRTTTGVAHAREAAEELARMSEELNELVGRFRV